MAFTHQSRNILSLLLLLITVQIVSGRNNVVFAQAPSSLASSPVSVQKDNPQIESQLINLFDTTMSPYCPGRTISACPSDKARELRDEMRGWMTSGVSAKEVKERLNQRYGDKVLGIPSSKGLGIFSWLMPIAFVATCSAGIALLLRRMRKPFTAEIQIETKQQKQTSQINVSPDLKQRVERELKKRLVT